MRLKIVPKVAQAVKRFVRIAGLPLVLDQASGDPGSRVHGNGHTFPESPDAMGDTLLQLLRIARNLCQEGCAVGSEFLEYGFPQLIVGMTNYCFIPGSILGMLTRS